MAMQCDFCHKGVMYGHNVSHSKRRTPRVFRPNLHVAHVMQNGVQVKKKLCTKCLRMYKKVAAAVKDSGAQVESATVA
jgi:large subunit ribosomal protein L28